MNGGTGEKIESKSEFNGGKERRSRNGLPIFGNFRFVNCCSCSSDKLVCLSAMDTRARARNPRNPPPFTIRFIEYDNSIAITPADFLPSKHDVFTNFCVFNFFHGGKRGKYLADSLYLPHFLFRVLRAITTCRPMFSSKYGIITVYLVRELSLSILNRVSHVQFQLSSLSLSLFSIC